MPDSLSRHLLIFLVALMALTAIARCSADHLVVAYR